MKEWNSPHVWALGVENTNECECLTNISTLDKDPNKNLHYCHDYINKGLDGPFHQNNCTSLGQDHVQSGSKCGQTHWTGEHKSNCCCAADLIS